MAADADGDFVVVWESDGSSGTDTSGDSIQGQRYASDGSTQGAQFQVNTYTTNPGAFQRDPAAARMRRGLRRGVGEPWARRERTRAVYSIQGQRYASTDRR